ncbi:sulfite exporter TauE/SafE family protein [Crenobacter cavernae]|uniref:Sulfite exporter TauE/SafE family protein n=1 Tax=Crenobacter cavernae TaxID=2290923 RepID=A0A345Y7T6_9NEIS|nr:sulfite exporter TauE/SafE family protein [Crenobacter cavernae]AXK39988.1 sulfite exporter TauE/SafE family protein [Crenobacter cavernae]
MLEINWLALFVVGLLGGGHCVGMCGGVVTALSFGLPASRVRWPLMIAYNLGRVGSYTLVGALLGALAQAGLSMADFAPLRWGLFVAAQLMLIALGLYLAGLSALVTRFETLGRPFWRRVQPFIARFLPVRKLGQALAVGALWGWMPCGLVYSASLSALASGSALKGASLMLAFGLGTLPNLLLMGAFADRLKTLLQKRALRLVAGLSVLALGVVGLLQWWLAQPF